MAVTAPDRVRPGASPFDPLNFQRSRTGGQHRIVDDLPSAEPKPPVPQDLVDFVAKRVRRDAPPDLRGNVNTYVEAALRSLVEGGGISLEDLRRMGPLNRTYLNEKALNQIARSIALDLGTRSKTGKFATQATKLLSDPKRRQETITVATADKKNPVQVTLSQVDNRVESGVSYAIAEASFRLNLDEHQPGAATRLENGPLRARLHQSESQQNLFKDTWSHRALRENGIANQMKAAAATASTQENVVAARKSILDGVPENVRPGANEALNDYVQHGFSEILGGSGSEYDLPVHGFDLAQNTMSYIVDRLDAIPDVTQRARIETEAYDRTLTIARVMPIAADVRNRLNLRADLKEANCFQNNGAFKLDADSQNYLRGIQTETTERRARAEAVRDRLQRNLPENLRKLDQLKSTSAKRAGRNELEKELKLANLNVKNWQTVEQQLEAGFGGQKVQNGLVNGSEDAKLLDDSLRNTLERSMDKLLGLAAETAMLSGEKGKQAAHQRDPIDDQIRDILHSSSWSNEDKLFMFFVLMSQKQTKRALTHAEEMYERDKIAEKLEAESRILESEHTVVYSEFRMAEKELNDMRKTEGELKDALKNAEKSGDPAAIQAAQTNFDNHLVSMDFQNRKFVDLNNRNLDLKNARNMIQAKLDDAKSESEVAKMQMKRAHDMSSFFTELASDFAAKEAQNMRRLNQA